VTRRGGKRRLGVFGGTFDPVHAGHLIMAQEAAERLGLERLLFVPTGRPAHKRERRITPVEHRLAMLRLAIRGNPRFAVSALEAERPGLTFTVHTLERLAAADRSELYFLMGQDSLEDFRNWREPDRILALARLVVAPRGEGERPSLDPATRRRVVFLKPPRIGIDASEIRRRIRRGRSVRYWVPDAVLAYIGRHGLYGSRG
jgi:nicotinate-nucleotide adenylyltransferase